MSAAGPSAFRLASEHRDGVRVLSPAGELDLATAPQLADAFGDGPLVLELDGLDFIDSTGLATLISEQRRRVRTKTQSSHRRLSRLSRWAYGPAAPGRS